MDTIDPDRLSSIAIDRCGTDDFGPPIFMTALRALTDSVNAEAEITAPRRTMVTEQWLHSFAVRARVAAELRRHPEIRGLKIEAPVFITGLWRTGTTALHNTLAAAPGLRGLKFWEMRSPVRRDDAGADREALAQAQRALDLLYAVIPGLAVIHPMNADWADECAALLRHEFATLNFAVANYAPSYVRWCLTTDMRPHYAYFADLLRALTWRAPGQRLVLKDPCHLFHLDALLDVFPDARVVVLSRDLHATLGSMASLFHTLHSFASGRRDPTKLADYVLALAEEGLSRLAAVRASREGAFIDVDYREVAADPVVAAWRVCEAVGVPVPEGARAEMGAWNAARKASAPPRHVYSLADFGLGAEAVDRVLGRFV